MTPEQPRTTYYVASIRDTGLLMSRDRSAYEAPESERASWRSASEFQARSGINAVWQVDMTEDFNNRPVEAVLLAAANIYTPHMVTQLYPTPPDEASRLENARSQLRADYWNDVRNVIDDVKTAIERRDLTTEDEVAEYIDAACENAQRGIYTGQAIECLLFTRNDEAYEEAGYEIESLLGCEESILSLLTRLAYFAFRADVLDDLGNVEALLEEAQPDLCEDCGEELPGDGEDDKCAECREIAESEDDETGEDNDGRCLGCGLYTMHLSDCPNA